MFLAGQLRDIQPEYRHTLRLLVRKGERAAFFIVRQNGRQRPLLFLRLPHLADDARADHALIPVGIRTAGLSGRERVRAVELKADARRGANQLRLAALVRAVEIKPVGRAGDEGKIQRHDVRALRAGEADAAAAAGFDHP